jgi:RNA methyltransferase, TrmH family
VDRGAFVVEGPQSVAAAVEFGRVRELYATPSAFLAHREVVDRAADLGARVAEINDVVAQAMSETEHPQGLIAVCDLQATAWPGARGAVAAEERAQIVVLDRVSDPGNAGTIIRSADAAGAQAVLLTAGSVDPHNGKCVRASAGSLFHLPVFTGADLGSVVGSYRSEGWRCVAADGYSESLLTDPAVRRMLAGPVIWVFGNEAHGVSPEVLAAVDAAVAIPILGRAESLNLAAAAAICLYAQVLADTP